LEAYKAVIIPFKPPVELLRDFRDMVNYCIQAGLRHGATSKFKLTRLVYRELTAKYPWHSWYALSAIEVACAILKNYRKSLRRGLSPRVPRARRLIAKIGNQALKVEEGRVRVPLRPRKWLYIPLHRRASEFVEAGCRLRSATLTPNAACLAFSKQVDGIEPRSWAAVDVNEDNVTLATSNGEVEVYELSRLKRAGYGYFARRKAIQRRYHGDRRVLKKALSKLSKNYRSLVSSELHKASAAIIKLCKERGYGLIVEDLRGLRGSVNAKVKRLNPYSGKIQPTSTRSKELKRRLNNWWFRRLLNQLEYKAKWEGMSIEAVDPKGSSSTCPMCRSKLKLYLNGRVECSSCGYHGDRHVTACLNLLKASDVTPRFGVERPLDVAVNPALTTLMGVRASWASIRGEVNWEANRTTGRCANYT